MQYYRMHELKSIFQTCVRQTVIKEMCRTPQPSGRWPIACKYTQHPIIPFDRMNFTDYSKLFVGGRFGQSRSGLRHIIGPIPAHTSVAIMSYIYTVLYRTKGVSLNVYEV